jgi:DNA repair protein RadD
MIHLRPPQALLESQIYSAWGAGKPNVLAVSPTGSGKTVLFSKFIFDHQGAAVVVAHRQELVSQISLALARNGVQHGIVAPQATCKMIAGIHLEELGRSYYNPQSLKRVAGVDSLRNVNPADQWVQQVTLAVCDEAHHNLADNKWGRGLALFKNAKGLGVTATPNRADGKGLGRAFEGVYDDMVVGPSMRASIDSGYLTDYRIVCAQPTDLQLDDVPIGPSGEFNYERVRDAVHGSSRIVGDVVRTYLQYARGKLGVTFAVDVEEATKLAREYQANGVPAEIVTAKTPDRLRAQILRQFKRRELLQLINVDLFGEGFDLPAIEVVSFARPTQSFPLFCQQFGRVLRLMVSPQLSEAWGDFTDAQRLQHISQSEKPVGLILDHVGNVFRHGLPDAATRHASWTLASRERRGSSGASDIEPLRICANPSPEALRMTTRHAGGLTYAQVCATIGEAAGIDLGMLAGPRIPCGQPFSRFKSTCPHCGFKPEPAERSTPEQVEGVLAELSPEALAAMRGAIEQFDAGPIAIPYGATGAISGALVKRARERREAQGELREAIAQWGGWYMSRGDTTPEQQRRFYYQFKVDVGSAQLLPAREAGELLERVKKDIDRLVNSL